MGAKTGISWTSATWNPIRGCSRVSEGCRNCYAESVAYRFSSAGQPYEGLAVLKNGHASWTGKVEFVDEHLLDPCSWRKPRRIFVNSMSDLFHENVTDEMRDKIFAVMALSARHQFQILTKRPKRMLEYLEGFPADDPASRLEEAAARMCISDEGVCALANWINGWSRWRDLPDDGIPLNGTVRRWPLPNVWLGVSVENAQEKHRIDTLRQVSATIRFLSLEPLLGPLGELDLTGISWAITGGESGPHARPMMSLWADDIRQQCEAAGVAFFHKQNGEFVDAGHKEFGKLPTGRKVALRSDGTEWDLEDMPEDENADVNTMVRVGRKRAGDTLYGRQYHAFPK